MRIHRWESKGGKNWIELFKEDVGYSYDSSNGGGNLGNITEAQAIQEINKLLKDSKQYDGITMVLKNSFMDKQERRNLGKKQYGSDIKNAKNKDGYYIEDANGKSLKSGDTANIEGSSGVVEILSISDTAVCMVKSRKSGTTFKIDCQSLVKE